MPRIIVKKRAEVYGEYVVGKKQTVSIGSSRDNDIVVNDKNVSESHCSLAIQDGKYYLSDNNSLFGTRVNGNPVTMHELQLGDVIEIGALSLVFKEDRKKQSEGGQKEPPARFLLGIYGKFEGKKFELKVGETFIGREAQTPRGKANDIVLVGDMTVSKGHAKVSCLAGQCVLMDTGSTGGVAVNGKKVGQLNEIALEPDDEVTVGRTIFRLAEEGDEDFSLPKKYRMFFFRARKPVIATFITLVVLFGVMLFARGLGGVLTAASKPGKLSMELRKGWSARGNVEREAPPVEYDIASAPALADLNRDGVNDIVYLNPSGMLYAWEGRKGFQLWQPVEIFNSGKTSPVVADINDDGVPDIIVISDTAMLYIIDGQTGSVILREMLGGTIAGLTPAVADLNFDGKQDIVACSEEGMVNFIYAPGYSQSMEKLVEFTGEQIYASPVIVASENNWPIVAVCSYNSRIFLYDGKTRVKKTIDLAEKTGKAHLITAAPAAGDINGDGKPELIVQSNVPQYVSAINLAQFNVLWTYFVEPIPPAGLRHTSSPLLVDVNGDGIKDVVVLSANGTVYQLKGNTGYPAGELIRKFEIPGARRIVASPALVDLNKEGFMDVVFGGEDGSLYVVTKNDSYDAVRISNSPITASVVVGDVDGDSFQDIVFADAMNGLRVVGTNVKSFKNEIRYAQYMGSPMHVPFDPDKNPMRPYLMKMMLGVGMMLGLVGGIKLASRKKMARRPKVVYV